MLERTKRVRSSLALIKMHAFCAPFLHIYGQGACAFSSHMQRIGGSPQSKSRAGQAGLDARPGACKGLAGSRAMGQDISENVPIERFMVT